MSSPTEQEIIAAIQESIDIFARREHVCAELPSAEVTRTFSLGATLAVSLLADLSGQWVASAAYNGTEFFAERTPEGEAHAAYEDDAIPLLPLMLVAFRDVAEGTCILGVSCPASADGILTQTAIALAAIGPRIDQMRATPVTHALAVAYEGVTDSVIALLDLTLHALKGPCTTKVLSLHSLIVREVMTASEAADTCLAATR